MTRPEPGPEPPSPLIRMAVAERRLDHHDETLRAISDTVVDIKEGLYALTTTVDGHTATLDRHGAILDSHTATLAEHTETLADHGGMLREILSILRPTA